MAAAPRDPYTVAQFKTLLAIRIMNPRVSLLPLFCLAIGQEVPAAPPRYDHVVVVIEENRTAGQIIGDQVNAPYITSLANGGVVLGSMFAIVHPS